MTIKQPHGVSKFKKAVIHVVTSIPRGTVASYGQVALFVGVPRGARQVGWILHDNEDIDLPWWRVINNAGRISIKGHKFNTPELQAKLLNAEGVEIYNDLTLDIEKYRWKPSDAILRSFELDDEYIEMIYEKYFITENNKL